jgi:hypothetical protein
MVVSVAGLLLSLYRQSQDNKDNQRKQMEREVAREARMSKLETKVDLFWSVVETNVGQLLKSPTHAEKDLLLDKLAHKELNIDEAERLRSILTDEMQLKGRDNGIIAYALIIGRLEGILYELRAEKNKC